MSTLTLDALRHDDPLRYARATWSVIAEPSDTLAAHARAVLGPERALEYAQDATPEDLLRVLGTEVPRDAGESRTRDPLHRMTRAVDRWRGRLKQQPLQAALEVAEKRGIHLLTPEDAQWPPGLHDLQAAAPACLWWTGDSSALADLPRATASAVAVVGCRASTPYGDDVAASLGADLTGHGTAVISGGAYGIDAAAHRGALGAGGMTHAVLAGGLDRLYPRGNTELLRAVAGSGLLLSESPPGAEPTRWRFLARNRLIAALTSVTTVVQAGWRSGALSTASRAEELSRIVAAVPGPVTSPQSQGCHRLIRERGAVLVTDAHDVLDLIPGQTPRDDQNLFDPLDVLSPADHRVFDAIPPRSTGTVEAISSSIGEPLDAVRSAISRLEILGMVTVTPRGVRRNT